MMQFVDSFAFKEPYDPTAESVAVKLFHNLGNSRFHGLEHLIRRRRMRGRRIR
jgi:hypothetical protein